jgi:hypothetical protein
VCLETIRAEKMKAKKVNPMPRTWTMRTFQPEMETWKELLPDLSEEKCAE